VRDELGGVGETVPPVGLSKSQKSFQDVVNGIDKLPD